MPEVFQISDVVSAMEHLGAPVAYLLFTMWLYVRLEKRTDGLLAEERARTDAERKRAENLQALLFENSKAQIEALLKNDATLNAFIARGNKP